MAKPKNYGRRWYSSTLLVLSVLFILVSVVTCWMFYNFDMMMWFKTIMEYALGMTGTALLVFILGYIFRKPIKRSIQRWILGK